ncbi:TMM26-like protein [Mya arenaria]|uniref:TMM26-like protein n=1 Tax=Mya arenaria TaxID=6604 RepID=A0ABY7DE58_MYAAR|nr:TMM26-like protein [Mya arenaria]
MSIEKDGIPQDLLDPSEEAEIHYYDAEGSLDSSTAKKRKKKKTKRHRKDAILELVNEVENIRTFTVGPGKSIVGELPDINIKNNDTRKKTDTKLEQASGLESIGIEAPGIPTVRTGLPDLTQENNDISKRIAESHPIVKNEREQQTKTKYIETDGGQSLDVERGDGKDRNQDKEGCLSYKKEQRLRAYSTVSTTAKYNTTTTSKPGVLDSIANTILSVEDSTWIVVIQELMIYVLLCVVWLLDNVPHDLLSQQLIAFLASASDIMELYALFDESAVQKDFTVTCVVLGVWTVSFIQFVPVLHQRSSTNKVQDSSMMTDIRDSYEHGPWEIAECIVAIIFQDGPFLSVRLFVVIDLQLVTYSLVFFLIKNLLSLVLLVYRLIGLCS